MTIAASGHLTPCETGAGQLLWPLPWSRQKCEFKMPVGREQAILPEKVAEIRGCVLIRSQSHAKVVSKKESPLLKYAENYAGKSMEKS